MGTKNYEPFLFFDVFWDFFSKIGKIDNFQKFGQNSNFLLNTCIIVLPQLYWAIIYQFLKISTKFLIFQIFDLKIAKKFDKFIEFFWKLVFQVPTPQTRLANIKLMPKYDVQVFRLKPVFCQLSGFFVYFDAISSISVVSQFFHLKCFDLTVFLTFRPWNPQYIHFWFSRSLAQCASVISFTPSVGDQNHTSLSLWSPEIGCEMILVRYHCRWTKCCASFSYRVISLNISWKKKYIKFKTQFVRLYYVSGHRQTHEEIFMIYLRIETCVTSVSRTYKTITLHMITHKKNHKLSIREKTACFLLH